MGWIVEFVRAFASEFDDLPEAVQDELLAHARLLEAFGPALGRPSVDTLNGSRFANRKELRFQASRGTWRVAFAFDPRRRAILLAAGDKACTGERRFYERLIRRGDERFGEHRRRLRSAGGDS